MGFVLGVILHLTCHPSAESQIHSPALLGFPLQERLLYSICEVQSIPFSKCWVWNKGTDCLSWCSYHLSESSHMMRAMVWFSGVPQQGRGRKAFLQILPSSECSGHRSLPGAVDMIWRSAGVIRHCFSWAAVIVLSQGSVVVNHQVSNRSAMRQTSLCLEKLGQELLSSYVQSPPPERQHGGTCWTLDRMLICCLFKYFFFLYSALLLSQAPLSHGVCVCRRKVWGANSAGTDLTPEEPQGSRTIMEKKTNLCSCGSPTDSRSFHI